MENIPLRGYASSNPATYIYLKRVIFLLQDDTHEQARTKTRHGFVYHD